MRIRYLVVVLGGPEKARHRNESEPRSVSGHRVEGLPILEQALP